MTKRAILYARVSGDDRKYATSGIESQLADCRKYAEGRGYEIVGDIFETPDKVTSGADWLPELDRVMKLAQGGDFDVLIVREIDRLARNRFKQMSVEIQLESWGVRVEYVIGQFEESAEGRLLKGLMSEFAEYEREKIRQRTRRGVIRSVNQGNVTTGGSLAPYGYDLAVVDGRRVLAVNEQEAAAVQLIFDLYVNRNYSLYAICEHLDKIHVPKPAKGQNHKARRSSATWSASTLCGIMDNETYIGRWYYRKTKRVKDVTGKYRYIDRPREEWIQIAVPAILPEDLFNAAQIQRGTNKRQMGHKRKFDYLLGGMLVCGLCGNGVTGLTRLYNDKRYSYYKCNAHHSPKTYGFKCDNTHFRGAVVDRAVWEWVKAISTSPETLQEALDNYQARQAEEQKPLMQMIESTAARLEETEKEKARLLKAYTSGVLSLEDIATGKVELDKRAADLTQALTNLRNELTPTTITRDVINRIQQDAADMRVGILQADDDPVTQRRILEQLQVRGRLFYRDGKRWIEVDSVLGAVNFTVDYTTADVNVTANCTGVEKWDTEDADKMPINADQRSSVQFLF